MFSRSSVCPQGGCLPLVPGVSATLPRQTSPRQTPQGRHPQGRHPLDRLPSRQTSPWTHPPTQCMLGYTPPAQCMLGYTHTLPSACWDTHTPCPVHAGIRITSGRYASHWYAFLVQEYFHLQKIRPQAC